MAKRPKSLALIGAACALALSLAAAQANQEKPDHRLYGIDSDHTQATFEFRRFGISTVTARFAKTGGTIAISREPRALNATLSIDVDSVSTGSAWLDKRLKSDSFLDAQRYPTITFKSTASRYSGDRLNSVSGELTIHGVTRPASFDIGEYSCAAPTEGSTPTPCEAKAELSIKRSDYGITGLMAIVSDRVVIRIKVSAQPMSEEPG
jgi:polyisoprenoid-binding protein YceI